MDKSSQALAHRTRPRTGRRRVVRTRADWAALNRATAAESTVDESTVDARDDAEPARRRRWPVTTVLLLVALAAALVTAGVYGHRWYDRRQLDAAHQQALAAARQETVNFVSISASTVDSDLQRIVTGATGQFKDEFTRGMPQVRAAVVENNVESRGTVLRAGLVSGDRDSAVVLIAVDATVKNAHAPDGRRSHYRIQVDMSRDRRSGRWLVATLQFVG